VKAPRPAWDFPYQPVAGSRAAGEIDPVDVVVATPAPVALEAIRAALAGLAPEIAVTALLDRAPLHWVRVRSPSRAPRDAIERALATAGIPVRYVAPATRGSEALAPSFDWRGAEAARPGDWADRPARPLPAGPAPEGSWFLDGRAGLGVRRDVCGTGAGTRLAVVDDDAADFDRLELERVVHVGIDRLSLVTGHAAVMIGWAVGAVRSDGTRFVGVAPDTSVRAYCVPKAGEDVVSVPLAIALAVLDGADVVVCATYLDGTASPMLDDALEVAVHLGRGGRGAVVMLPTGREASSPPGSVHASLTLALGDPASDPRVHCVAPGGRAGGWFLWQTARGRLRPFSNRGPAVRWLAPGDDVEYPFAPRERLFHAESSGAVAMAAGAVLLVLGANPDLQLHELHAVLVRCTDAPDPADVADPALADPADVLPSGRDPDGHDAKCGYGRLNAARACASARDPLALALDAVGEPAAAARWCTTARPYSEPLARWAARALLGRPDLEHAARVLVRHARLTVADPARGPAHGPAALARQLAMLVRALGGLHPLPAALACELDTLFRSLRDLCSAGGPLTEASLDAAARALFARPSQRPSLRPPAGPMARATLSS
jgi:hypothetical protein